MTISAPTSTRLAGFEISVDRNRLDLDQICAWLADSYWAGDRDRDTIQRSIAHSHPYGVYAPSGEQVAFTRATTDLATFCWLGDVIVDPAFRGIGIGTWLVSAVLEHLKSLGVERFVLATRDAHEVYARLGFTELRVPAIWMEIDERSTRPNPGDPIGRENRAIDSQLATGADANNGLR